MKNAKATVVVPCLNGGSVLGSCLDALNNQTARDRLRIVVVDNGSVDDSIAHARAAADTVLTTRLPGPSGPRNRGLEVASTPLLLSIDADCVPSSRWAELHLDALSDAPEDVLASTGRFEPFPTTDRWALREDITPHTSFDAAGPQYALAGNGCFRTDRLRSLGGFPQFSADDAALGIRARAASLRFIYVPDAMVYHRNPEGWRAYARHARKIGRYAAEFDHGEAWLGHLLRTRLRMLAGALKPGLHGNFFESSALLTTAVAGGIGVVDARLSRAAHNSPQSVTDSA